MEVYKAAVGQIDSQNDKLKNLQLVCDMIGEAAGNGAQLIVFPEDMNLVGENLGPGGNAESVPGLTSRMISQKAEEAGIYVHLGSFHEKITDLPGEKRAYNTSLFFGPDGKILARYHKRHCFDIIMPDGTATRESDSIRPGEETVICQTDLGCFGFSICYDLRFPEHYRSLAAQGAEIIFVPANFTKPTGQAHWETLLRARAIENGCYVIAADQTGKKPLYTAYGSSMIIDPWGRILARAGEETGICYAEIDLSRGREVRQMLPSTRQWDEFKCEF